MKNGAALFILFLVFFVVPKLWSWFIRYMNDRNRVRHLNSWDGK